MPSIWEAASLQALEAMCMGIPLIASNCIGLRETVRDTPAIVFESRNSKALAEAMDEVRTAPPYAKFQNFRAVALVRFDVRKVANKLSELIAQQYNAGYRSRNNKLKSRINTHRKENLRA